MNGKSTWTIDELKELPATEKTITQDCAGQGMNGALISNFTVTLDRVFFRFHRGVRRPAGRHGHARNYKR